MASLNYIHYLPHRVSLDDDDQVKLELDTARRSIKNLPQLFWNNGSPWIEVNLWAHERASSGKTDIKTVKSNLTHLHKYAEWLEEEHLDWRHFPLLERDRVLVRWRKHLIGMREIGVLAPSTATARMNAAIHFYRYARVNEFIGRDTPMWNERQVVHSYYDAVGFERTMMRLSTDLSIPNRRRHGLRLENGLSPISRKHMSELLTFVQDEGNASQEIQLMLNLGFFSGARLETIADLKKGTLAHAVSDPAFPGLVFFSVGPGARPSVATKFDVQGRIMVPESLYHALCDYVVDPRRLRREVVASDENKDLIFLTRFGKPYVDPESTSGNAIGRAMVDLRRAAVKAGLKFMQHFHFHMARATFGTWLTATLLEKNFNAKAVLTFVSDAMLHKDIETTLRYIRFVEQTPIRIEIANEFTEAYLGLSSRLGSGHA